MKKLLIACCLAIATTLSVNAENKVKNFNQTETRNYKYEVHKNNSKNHEKSLKSQHNNHRDSNSHRHGPPRQPDHRSDYHRDGYYEYVTKTVWVPERCHRVWIPARYEYRRQPCGRFIRVLVCKGYYQEKTIPGYYDYQTVRVWRPYKRCGTRNNISIRWGW